MNINILFVEVFKRTLTIRLTLFLLLLGSFTSCKENVVDPKEDPPPETWKAIPLFEHADIRELKIHNDMLYLNLIDESLDANYRGYLYRSSNGMDWVLLAKFKNAVSPIAFNGDTLYCLADSLYKMTPNRRWSTVCGSSYLCQEPEILSDLVFWNDELFAMQSIYNDSKEVYRIRFDGTYQTVPVWHGYSSSGARFIKVMIQNHERLFVWGQYYIGGFYEFDGKTFIPIATGLTANEYSTPGTKAYTVKGDTIFGSFVDKTIHPRIMYFNGESWKPYTCDSLPYSSYAYNYHPPLLTECTGLAFSGEILFSSTQMLGVLMWKNNKWISISEGLPKPASFVETDFLDPIPIFCIFHGTLLAGYGKPAYAPWGGDGLYSRKITE